MISNHDDEDGYLFGLKGSIQLLLTRSSDFYLFN